jgi:hypothetical protein
MAKNASKTVAVAAPVVKSRNSRLPTQGVLDALQAAGATGRTVPTLAVDLGVSERDVRLCIDKLRVLKYAIVRSAKMTFALSA